MFDHVGVGSMHVQNLFLVLLDKVADFHVGGKHFVWVQSVMRLQRLFNLHERLKLAGKVGFVALGV